MSTIFLKNLVVSAKHGVYDSEKIHEQRFKIDLELEVDNDSAFESDDVKDTIDYAYVRQVVINTVQNNSFDLIERLAQAICDQVLMDTRILQITISIFKLDAFESGVPGIKIIRDQPPII
jgi:dihydroneopterin aldolase